MSIPGPTSSTLFTPGRQFGNYTILELLGSGGMGEVYRAKDTRLGREVAIKTIGGASASHPEFRLRFEREARSASALHHANIVTIYELGEHQGTPYIAMELVEGRSLRALLDCGPLPFPRTMAIAAQIAEALAKAHECGVVHRDLKPDNIMVSAEGAAKILDFGLAKLFEAGAAPDVALAATSLTAGGAMIGTSGYMSPEQVNGSNVDFRSDQFSLGCVLYEMLTGEPAFCKETVPETAVAVLRSEPERILAKTLPAPAPLVWIVERCLAKEPHLRYASTRDLARDLAAVRDRLLDAPARQIERKPHNLPVQRTAFIGRESESRALRELLSRPEVRLETLTGPGGIGKTRLVLQVAAEMAAEFPAGIFFTPLSAVTDPALIVSAIAQAIGLRANGSESVQQAVESYIAGIGDRMLLVLDNFEHLVASAAVTAGLISLSPQITIVVTSQSPLHVYGEHEFPVPPLAAPDSKASASPEALSQMPAVQLFVARAKAVKHDFALSKENAAAVAAICARLDGLPLAIELAAARVKLLSPSAMLARLRSCLDLLSCGPRDLPMRQQTLRGTLNWSYCLLTPEEQTLFRRLAVFVGGCTLEGVEAVCDTKGDLGLDLLDGMTSIIDKCLIQQVEHDSNEPRFVFLSTIREYALERLASSDEEAEVRRAHAAYHLVLAEEGSRDAALDPEWRRRFELEHDNFRAAVDHLIGIGDAEWALRLATALFPFWESREFLGQGRECIDRALNMQGAAGWPKLRGRLLFAGAVLAGEQGEHAAARDLFEQCLHTSSQLKDERGVAVALNALAVNARERGDLDKAVELFNRAAISWRELGDVADLARGLSNLASVRKMQRKYEEAAKLYDDCLALFRQIGDACGIAWTLNYQGDIARDRSDSASARRFYTESLAAFRKLRDDWGVASVLSDLAGLSRDAGDLNEAHRLYCDSLRAYEKVDHKRGIARVLESVAGVLAANSAPEDALRLAGAAAALRQNIGAPLSTVEQARLEHALNAARRTLSNEASLAAWMEGWQVPTEQAISEAVKLNTEPRLQQRSSA